MRIIFFGSSRFSLPVLEALLASSHSVIAVVTTPPKLKGRKQKLIPSLVADFAKAKGIFTLEPEKLKDIAGRLKELAPDLGVIASYGKIIPKELLILPNRGIINVHPSLLPKWRGPSPIQAALLAGERKTGVTIHVTTEQVDAGPIILQKEVEILPEETYLELEEHIAKLGGALLLESIKKIAKDNSLSGATAKYAVSQPKGEATFSKKITTQDGRINWQESSQKIFNQIRALNPEPGTFTFVENASGAIKRLLILHAALEKSSSQKEAGIMTLAGDSFKITALDGFIVPIEIQIEGRNKTSAKSFLKGNPWIIGKQLG